MSFEEIVEELPRLTADEKQRLRQLLDFELSWTEAEEQAIDEGIRSREEDQACLGKSSMAETPKKSSS
jgi:hypothetical protein